MVDRSPLPCPVLVTCLLRNHGKDKGHEAGCKSDAWAEAVEGT